MFAIAFDMDIKELRNTYGDPYNNAYLLKTDDIHPPKSVISVHFFCLTCLMALQI